MTPINNKYAQTLEHRIKRLGERELPSNDPLLAESVLILAKTIAEIADDARGMSIGPISVKVEDWPGFLNVARRRYNW
jgi:hypothetical protein